MLRWLDRIPTTARNDPLAAAVRDRGMVDRRGLRAFAKAEPLAVLQQVLGWYGNAANLRNVRGALTAEAVANHFRDRTGN